MQDAVTLASTEKTREAHRAACEARDWIRRGHVPGSLELKATLRTIASKRGKAAADRLEHAIQTWYVRRHEWLPGLIRRHAEAIGERWTAPSPTEQPRSFASRTAAGF